MTPEHSLDVRDLPAPEPLQMILEELTSLDDGQFLHVIHRREPHCLFRALEEFGYRYCSRDGGDSRLDIWIWLATDLVAALGAKEAAGE